MTRAIGKTDCDLDDELFMFADKQAGDLVDVKLLRQEVRSGWESAKARSKPCPGIQISDRQTDEGLRLRIYQPRQSGSLPALIYCHGGAFLLGFPELEDPGCVRYALGANCVVISVDYRLAPEHRYPAGVDDCFAALRWTARHHRELDIDADRIAVGGSSAGGALAAAVALMSRDRGGPRLCFQMLIYPALDDRLSTPSMRRFIDTPVFARRTAAAMWRHYLGEQPSDVSPYAAPARAGDLSGLPPAYLEACALDPLRDENIAYAAGLLTAGNATELHVIPGAPHGFDQFYLGAPTKTFWPTTADFDSHPGHAETSAAWIEADLHSGPALTRRAIQNRIAALSLAFRQISASGPPTSCPVPLV